MKNKNSAFSTIGATGHGLEERQAEDYYATPSLATKWLCKLEDFADRILEPACGEGHISEVLKSYGYDVVSRDIVDRGYGEIADFLSAANKKWDGDIVTNPPFRYADKFVEQALRIIPEGHKVAFFLKLGFLEGKARRKLFSAYPPARVWVSSSRLRCAKDGDFEHQTGNAIAFAWFVWVKGYNGDTILKWFN